MYNYDVEYIKNKWKFKHNVYIFNPDNWNGKTLIILHGIPFQFSADYPSATSLKEFGDHMSKKGFKIINFDNTFSMFKENIKNSNTKSLSINMRDYLKYSLNNAENVIKRFSGSETYLYGASWGSILIQSLSKKSLKRKKIIFSNTITFSDQWSKERIIGDLKVDKYLVKKFNSTSFDISDKVSKFFHGENDHIKTIDVLMNQVPKNKIEIFSNSDHALTYRNPANSKIDLEKTYDNWNRVYEIIEDLMYKEF